MMQSSADIKLVRVEIEDAKKQIAEVLPWIIVLVHSILNYLMLLLSCSWAMKWLLLNK
jgi:hypothetical protein